MTNRERAHYQELRKAVANQFGHGSPDVWTQKHFVGLSEEIQEKTGQYLSSHTLRRVAREGNVDNQKIGLVDVYNQPYKPLIEVFKDCGAKLEAGLGW